MRKFESAIKQIRMLTRGDHLFSAGERFRGLYAVRSGSMKASTVTDSGEEQILGFFLPGDVFGMEAIDSNTHDCTAIALETSSVCELSLDRLEHLGCEITALQHQINRMYAQEIARNHAMLRMLGRKNAEQRLASFLANLSDRLAARGFSASEFNLSMSRSDIANYLGLALETVSRLLARFQEENLVAVKRRNIHLLNLPALKVVAGETVFDEQHQYYH
jgi:CRP/FNR family transcriptional regulator